MSVCNDQQTFQDALKQAEIYVIKRQRPSKVAAAIATGIYIVFVVWAVMLALRVAPQDEQVKHIVFAVLFPPIYVVSVYLGARN